MWVDSHCHINFPDFAAMDGGVEGVIERARLNRVGHMLNISTHTKRLPESLNLAEKHAHVFSSVGVHPHNVTDDGEAYITTDDLIKFAQHPKIIAIGESGLDYHYDFAPKDVQHDKFRQHIRAAAQTGLPLVIHAREADDDIIAILKDERAKLSDPSTLTGVMHCFSSTQALADYAVEIGFCVSFSGVLTFKNAVNLQDIAKTIPHDKLLVETDAPYLAPIPYRGRTNEPAYVTHTGRFLAGLHGIDEAEMERITTDNFFNLFKKAVR
ncbi:MAG TPA: TatD family hydrolase [Alphaproteobacteria bacterium]